MSYRRSPGECSAVGKSRSEWSINNWCVSAFSFGVPVIAYKYAPGPARLIELGVNGLLLEDMPADNVFRP